ncbi:DUF2791 family P-loop domain-containing protein [bacterium]|nr:DUF2791 family P-loop domain-containing protein [FCB group bacterium]MBL7190061.1 DUF2791 family P-loop domain-containing protein [bacterium]
MAEIVYKERNPFTPDEPVSKENFVGREKEIEMILRSAHQVSMGVRQSFFIVGDYGIGKSSLASYIKYAVHTQFNLAAYHIYLSDINSLEDMSFNIVTGLIKQSKELNVIDKVKKFLGEYIKEIHLFNVDINTEALKRDAFNLSSSFASMLQDTYAYLQDDFKGIALILDDLNGISDNPRFAPLIKSTVDSIATSSRPLPLLLIFCGVEKRRLDMISHHPSIARIFSVIDVKPLSDNETAKFFRDSFDKIGFKIEKEALDTIVYYSSGLPRLMHEIGNSVFWVTEKKYIDSITAMRGIRGAVDEIGRKYFGPLQKILTSKDYRSILRSLLTLMGKKSKENLVFDKKEIIEKLSDAEAKKFNNFLQRMKNINAIHPGDIRGEWFFSDYLTFWYFYFETEKLLKINKS